MIFFNIHMHLLSVFVLNIVSLCSEKHRLNILNSVHITAVNLSSGSTFNKPHFLTRLTLFLVVMLNLHNQMYFHVAVKFHRGRLRKLDWKQKEYFQELLLCIVKTGNPLQSMTVRCYSDCFFMCCMTERL